MKEYTTDISSRRDVLSACLRYAALAALAAVGASAFFKRRRLLRQGTCINDGFCQDCMILESCGLPAALSAKKTSAGADNG